MQADSLSLTLSALADPTRRAIIARLSKGEATASELAAPFSMSFPAVSKHLKVLERAGLVETGREAQFRPRRLRPQPLQELSSWLDRYREFWEGSLDQLDSYIKTVKSEEEKT